jgi:limonene-1,2-epoxide hydrolase
MARRIPSFAGAGPTGRVVRSALLALTLVAASCATQTVSRSGSGMVAGTSPLQSVERFLSAVNARDLDAMASVFGTADGPVEGERVEIEIRMDAVATILEHQSYEIVSERQVPGRIDPTTRVGVTLRIDGEVHPDVAFLTVRTGEGRWMVQEIDLEAITGG